VLTAKRELLGISNELVDHVSREVTPEGISDVAFLLGLGKESDNGKAHEELGAGR
jgi:hypothetical protein